MSVSRCQRCDHVQYNPDDDKEQIIQIVTDSYGKPTYGLTNRGRVFLWCDSGVYSPDSVFVEASFWYQSSNQQDDLFESYDTAITAIQNRVFSK